MYKEKKMYLVGDVLIDISEILHISPTHIEFIPNNSSIIDIDEEEYTKLFKIMMKETKIINPEDYIVKKLENSKKENREPRQGVSPWPGSRLDRLSRKPNPMKKRIPSK